MKTAALILSCLMSLPVMADALYTYTGLPLTPANGQQNICNGCSVTGSFTLYNPLPPNFDSWTACQGGSCGLAGYMIEDFSFTDGVGLTSTFEDAAATIRFQTDGTGNIIMWLLYIDSPGPYMDPSADADGIAFVIASYGDTLVDSDCDSSGGDCALTAYNGTSGTWTEAPEAQPFLLVGSGLIALTAIFSWKARRGLPSLTQALGTWCARKWEA
jgi:hypothetical protein